MGDRCAYTGFAFILAGAVISWEYRKRRSVALSNTEAEYRRGVVRVNQGSKILTENFAENWCKCRSYCDL